MSGARKEELTLYLESYGGFQLNYANIPSIGTELPIKLRENITSLFEINESKGTEIKITGPTITKGSLSQWVLTNKDKKLTATIAVNSINFKSDKLVSTIDFSDEFNKLIGEFKEAFPEVRLTRIGLRHVHIVKIAKGNPFEWGDYISSKVLSLIKNIGEERNELSRVMGQYVFNREFYHVIFNFGIANPEYPARITRRHFLFDVDCFTPEVNIDIIGQTKGFNEIIGEVLKTETVGELQERMETIYG